MSTDPNLLALADAIRAEGNKAEFWTGTLISHRGGSKEHQPGPGEHWVEVAQLRPEPDPWWVCARTPRTNPDVLVYGDSPELAALREELPAGKPNTFRPTSLKITWRTADGDRSLYIVMFRTAPVRYYAHVPKSGSTGSQGATPQEAFDGLFEERLVAREPH